MQQTRNLLYASSCHLGPLPPPQMQQQHPYYWAINAVSEDQRGGLTLFSFSNWGLTYFTAVNNLLTIKQPISRFINILCCFENTTHRYMEWFHTDKPIDFRHAIDTYRNKWLKKTLSRQISKKIYVHKQWPVLFKVWGIVSLRIWSIISNYTRTLWLFVIFLEN